MVTEMASHFLAKHPPPTLTPPLYPIWKLSPGICKWQLIGEPRFCFYFFFSILSENTGAVVSAGLAKAERLTGTEPDPQR